MTTTERKRMISPHQPVGRWIRVEKRLAIYLRDSFTCLYCGRDLRDADPRDVALDHLTPKCDGGSNDATNLVTACATCNCTRRDLPWTRFASPEARKHIRRNVRRNLTPFVTLAKAIFADKTGESDR